MRASVATERDALLLSISWFRMLDEAKTLRFVHWTMRKRASHAGKWGPELQNRPIVASQERGIMSWLSAVLSQ